MMFLLFILTASVWMAAGVTHTCPVLPGVPGKDGIDGSLGPPGATGASGSNGPPAPPPVLVAIVPLGLHAHLGFSASQVNQQTCPTTNLLMAVRR